jgi:hypothetical protein
VVEVSNTDAKLIAELSNELFHGGLVPADLAALWSAQERDDTDLLDAFELVLIIGLHTDDVIAPFVDDPDSDPAALAALRRLLDEVTFVAEALDGTMLGYWTPPASDVPVVLAFDAQGQLVIQGQTFAEALLSLTDPDDPDESAEVVEGLRAYGIEPAATTVEAVFSRVSGIPEPNEVVLGYLLDARLERSAGSSTPSGPQG